MRQMLYYGYNIELVCKYSVSSLSALLPASSTRWTKPSLILGRGLSYTHTVPDYENRVQNRSRVLDTHAHTHT